MIIVLKNGITKKQAEDFKDHLEESRNVKVCPIAGTLSTVYGLVGDTYKIDIDSLRQDLSLIHIYEPTRHFKRARMPSSA